MSHGRRKRITTSAGWQRTMLNRAFPHRERRLATLAGGCRGALADAAVLLFALVPVLALFAYVRVYPIGAASCSASTTGS